MSGWLLARKSTRWADEPLAFGLTSITPAYAEVEHPEDDRIASCCRLLQAFDDFPAVARFEPAESTRPSPIKRARTAGCH